ncbi:hypothetical protein DYB32_004506 [Aphanomyces invadans]|uniref:Uncharacterized protein n=1 Tax=Aphanomyces invadans TaxID=157072 RepID=A0A418AXC2_9STRA|nr:hypothetical protein DYB32_004506 [Aphanomyces invadans]
MVLIRTVQINRSGGKSGGAMSSSRAFKVAFKCSACGKCCTGKGGKVRVNTREVEAIADHLSIPTKELRRHYLRRHRDDDFDSLKQTPDDRQCIFLDGKQCSIYPGTLFMNDARCYDWTLASKECEGILLDPSSDDDIIPDDRILKETVIHEVEYVDVVLSVLYTWTVQVHRSGENFTYNEINELVAEREYFDAADALQVHQQFGESFVSESLMAGALMDLIVVDVEDGTSHAVSDDRGNGLLRAPPASMTSFSFLQDIRQLLTPRGVFAVNAIDGDKPIGERAPRGSSVHCLSRRMAAVFDQVWMLELTANVIVFGVKGDSTSSAGPSGWSDENDALQEILDEFRPNLRRVQ